MEKKMQNSSPSPVTIREELSVVRENNNFRLPMVNKQQAMYLYAVRKTTT
jgi:hypothetical protein